MRRRGTLCLPMPPIPQPNPPHPPIQLRTTRHLHHPGSASARARRRRLGPWVKSSSSRLRPSRRNSLRRRRTHSRCRPQHLSPPSPPPNPPPRRNLLPPHPNLHPNLHRPRPRHLGARPSRRRSLGRTGGWPTTTRRARCVGQDGFTPTGFQGVGHSGDEPDEYGPQPRGGRGRVR